MYVCVVLFIRTQTFVCVCVRVWKGRKGGEGGEGCVGEGRRVCIGGRGICGVVKWSLYEGKGNVRRRGLCQVHA